MRTQRFLPSQENTRLEKNVSDCPKCGPEAGLREHVCGFSGDRLNVVLQRRGSKGVVHRHVRPEPPPYSWRAVGLERSKILRSVTGFVNLPSLAIVNSPATLELNCHTSGSRWLAKPPEDRS